VNVIVVVAVFVGIVGVTVVAVVVCKSVSLLHRGVTIHLLLKEKREHDDDDDEDESRQDDDGDVSAQLDPPIHLPLAVRRNRSLRERGLVVDGSSGSGGIISGKHFVVRHPGSGAVVW
jgi:hypothetical protein